MKRWRIFALLLALAVGMSMGSAASARAEPVRVASKVFTESVVLADVAAQLIEHEGLPVELRTQLGGTTILYDALRNNQIDVYPEYTGTIAQEMLHLTTMPPPAELRQMLAKQGIGMTDSLGFNDTYALGMRESVSAADGIGAISDLRSHPDLRLRFSNEFLERADGWPLLRSRYQLPQTDVAGLDHDLAYRALAAGKSDLTDLYSTDAEIAFYHLRVLRDDLGVFPEYDAVYLYRLDLASRLPASVEALRSLEGKIDATSMIAMNARAKLDKQPEASVAHDFLARTFHIQTRQASSGLWHEVWERTLEHLTLVGISLSAAIVVGLALGVVAAKRARLGQIILGAVAAIYTIPSLALLVFMIPLLGIGAWPAIVALFLYSLLPIVRNTHAGLTGIMPSLRESALVLGLTPATRLWRVELPLASPSILAGIQTSAVINVGTATLGALIGAGGYGQPILTGIRLDSTRLILSGAIPAAALALAMQGIFELLGRWVVPRGLRLRAEGAG